MLRDAKVNREKKGPRGKFYSQILLANFTLASRTKDLAREGLFVDKWWGDEFQQF